MFDKLQAAIRRGPREVRMHGTGTGPDPDPPEVRERFQEELELAERIARRITRSMGRAVQFDDLLSAAREGLLDAARKYDQSRGTSFRAYANVRIRGSVLDSLRRMGPLPYALFGRLGAVEAAASVSEEEAKRVSPNNGFGTEPIDPEKRLNDHLADLATAALLGFGKGACDADMVAAPDGDLNPEEAFAEAESLDRVRQAIEKLPTDYACVIRYYYFENCSLEATAEKLGVSTSWACRVHARAIASLTKLLTNTDEDSFY